MERKVYRKIKCILCKEQSTEEIAPFCKNCLKKPLEEIFKALTDERLKYSGKIKSHKTK